MTKASSTQQITLSQETLSALKALYEIDQSLKIDHKQTEKDDDDGKTLTVLRSKSFNNTTCMRVTIPEQFSRDINIYDLREFISVVSIVNEPIFDLSNDNYILIKSVDGKQKLRYLEANPDLINSFAPKDPSLKSVDETIIVTESQFKSVLTAAQTLKFEYIGFEGDGENIILSTFNKTQGSDQETNNYSITLTETDKKFKMIYKISLQKVNILAGEGDLMFSIDGKKKISEIHTSSSKKYWITFDASSEYDIE